MPVRLSVVALVFVAVVTSGRLEQPIDVHRLSQHDDLLVRHARKVTEAGASNSSCPSAPDNTTYRLTARIPDDCALPDCSFFVGISTNNEDPQFLDFMLEASAPGWAAVGFSESKNMFDANVLGCNRYQATDEVHAVDTWNPGSPNRYNFLNDQQRICQYSAGYEDGRIYCSFSRLIQGDGTDTNLNLDGEYYLLFGEGNTPAVTPGRDGFTYHEQIPETSPQTVNPVTASGEVTPTRSTFRERLTKAHGTLMVLAWPVLAGVAMFFAAWMKPALPNGQWLQVHRALMLTSLVVGVSAFILIFVANKDGDPPGFIYLRESKTVAHFVIGITVMVLHIVNPILALFRCKPDSEYRWIFNVGHGKLIGYTAILLSSTNIGIGVSLFLDTSHAAFEVFLAFIACAVFLYLVLYMIKFITSQYNTKQKDSLGTKENEETPLVQTKENWQSKVAWIALLLFLTVTLPLLITVIVLIAVE